MALSEQEIELLESYLDDGLEMSEVEALRTRLAADAEWLAALERVRDERAMRKSVFAGLEPDDASVSKVVANIKALARRRQFRSRWMTPARYIAAAACLAIGFFGRGVIDRSHADDGSAIHNVAHGGSRVNLQQVATYQVTLRDENGNAVAVQRFDSIDKAQEFAADLTRWQSRSERLASGRFVLSADRF
jgi:hypothetical protein